jgi:hypothetical protein
VWDGQDIEPRWSLSGDSLYLAAHGDLYEKEFGSPDKRRLTDFAGRPGRLFRAFDTDGKYVYFTWREDHGDLWVMDVDQDR